MDMEGNCGIIQCVEEISYLFKPSPPYKFSLNIIQGIMFVSFSLEPLGQFHLHMV